MVSFLLVLFLLTSFCLVVCVLLQAGKGGGLAAGFGGSGTGFELLGGRQTASFLHQATRWLGGAFLLIGFLIALLTARGNRPESLIEQEFEGQPQPVEQQPGTPQDLESVVGQPQAGTAEGGAAPAEDNAPEAGPPGGEREGAGPRAAPAGAGSTSPTEGATAPEAGAQPGPETSRRGP